MKEIVKLMIENPTSTLIVLVGLSFFVWIVSKHVPNPLNKINAIFKVLKHEGNPLTEKDWVERINWFSIILFALAFIIQLLIFGGSTILSSVIPEGEKKTLPSLCMVTLIFLFVITIYSPVLILLTKGDIALKKRGKKLTE